MKSKLVHKSAEHQGTFVVVLDTNENPVALLSEFAQRESLRASRITAIGGFSSAVLGYFDRETKRYEEIPVRAQAEVLSVTGDIAHYEGKPVAHVHAVLGLRDGTTRGGHLLDATVWPTLEIVLTEWPAYLRKEYRPDVGLPIIAGDPDD